jgi:hypothetical protein
MSAIAPEADVERQTFDIRSISEAVLLRMQTRPAFGFYHRSQMLPKES